MQTPFAHQLFINRGPPAPIDAEGRHAQRSRFAIHCPAGANYEVGSRNQIRAIERFAKLENKLIPPATDYAAVVGLRNEARQKLIKFTPRSLGQALRISGITPADVTLLAVHLERSRR